MPEQHGFEDLSDVVVDVIAGYECNVKCDYCTVTDDMRRRNMSTRKVLAELMLARQHGIHKVSFGGGEPTIRKDLLPLVAWCRDRGFDYMKVSSNGLMYSYEDYARRAVEAGITDFHISVMGHSRQLYSEIMGMPEAFDLVRKGVRYLVSLGVKPVADLIIKDNTFRALPDIVGFWASEGIGHFVLWLVSLTDRNRFNYASLPRVSEMAPHIKAAFVKGQELGCRVESRHIPRCMLKGYERFVRDLRQDRVLVVTPESRFRLWESVMSLNEYVEKCGRCRYYQGECLGVRRDYLERYGDGEVEPYP